MNKRSYKIINYTSDYFTKLKLSYEQSFNKIFITKELYERRFYYKDKYSSYLLISKDYEVMGHIGFRIHNFNNNLNSKIAFRFSTFLINSLRGSGIYLELMDHVKNDLKVKFNIDFIFAWPNRVNLISCLKDSDYINLNPIITWQHQLGNKEYNYTKEDNFIYKNLDLTNLDNEVNPKKFVLTKESKNNFKTLFKDRDNKKYKIIKVSKNKYAILGISIIKNRQFISIVLNNDLNINFIINVLNMYYKNSSTFVQCWCFHNDKDLLRQLLKSNFQDNGPVFYNGFYKLKEVKFTLNDYYPSMYNHDAF